MLYAEHKAIKEHRAKRKAAKTERELIGLWEPERMEIGETLPQIMARSRHIILKHRSKWNKQQVERAIILFEKFPDQKTAYSLFIRPADIFNKKSSSAVAGLSFARWYNDVEAFGNNRLNKVLETIENHNRRILNYFKHRLTNTPLRNHSMPK